MSADWYSGFAAADSMRELDDAVESAIRRNELFTEAKKEIDAVTVTEQSPDGAVQVTVRSSGALVDLTCTDLIRTMPARQVATTVLACVQAAQSGISRRVEEILRNAAPGDPLTSELVAQAHKAFTPPPTTAEPSTSGPRGQSIGEIEDDEPRPRSRRRPVGRSRPAAGYDDPDDWDGRSFLSGPARG